MRVLAMAENEARRGTIIKYQGEAKSWFTKVPIQALTDKKLSALDFRVYVFLLFLRYDAREKEMQPGGGVLYEQGTIAKRLYLSRRTIARSFDALEALGYCKRKKLSRKLTELTVIIRPTLKEQAAFELVPGKDYSEEFSEIDF